MRKTIICMVSAMIGFVVGYGTRELMVRKDNSTEDGMIDEPDINDDFLEAEDENDVDDCAEAIAYIQKGKSEDIVEKNNEDCQSEEDGTPLQPQEDVPIVFPVNLEDIISDDDAGYETEYDEDTDDESDNLTAEQAVALESTPEESVDDDKYNDLIERFGRPLIEKYGEMYEDRLIRMLYRMSSSYVNQAVYTDYCNRLEAILNTPNQVRGVKQLTSAMSNFFSLFPEDPDLYK